MRRPNFCLCCCCRLTEYFINRVIWCGAYAVVEVVWPLLTSSSSSVSCSEVILLSTLCGRRLAQLCGLSLDLLGSSIWSSVFTVVSSLLRLFTALRKQLRRPSPIRRLTTVEKGDYYWKGLSLSFSAGLPLLQRRPLLRGLSFPHMPPLCSCLPLPPPLFPCLHRRLRSRTSHHYHGLRSKTKAKALFRAAAVLMHFCYCFLAAAAVLCSLVLPLQFLID